MRLEGYVDILDTARVGGWVIDRDQVDQTIYVRVYLEERLLGIVPADLERPDLLAAGIPRSDCMYRFQFSRSIPLAELEHIAVIPEGTDQPLSRCASDFRSLYAAKFFPYYDKFEYSWWDGQPFEEPTDDLRLRGDLILPEGATDLVFSMNGCDPAKPATGLPTHGRARQFWYIDHCDSLGYEVDLKPDINLPFNEVWLQYQDKDRCERKRPIVRFPSDRRYARLVPSQEVLRRVIGPTARPYASYVVGGATDVMLMEFLLKKHTGRRIGDFRSVLDWGCGCGRTTWALAELIPAIEITGIDIDEPNLNYARSIIPRGRFILSGLYPPLPLENGAIDLIFSQSVLTHLSETAQDLWLAELERILAPDGVAILSLQLEVTSMARSFDVDMIQNYFAYGIEDFVRDPALAGIVVDENYYRSTFHTTEYVGKRWSKTFDIVGIEPGFMGGHQDAVICVKKQAE